MRIVFVLFALMTVAAGGACGMVIEPDAPGAIHAAGDPVKVTVRDAKGEVRYLLRDYFGRRAASGSVESDGGIAGITASGLKPGWYELKCTDDAGTALLSVGVVINRGDAPLPEKGRVCVDAASAWLIKNDDQRKPFAEIVAMAGFPWVRERLSWPEVEPEPGKINWGHYQTVADTLSAEGVWICQVWHSLPPWTHPGSQVPAADDLRAVYNFSKEAASHFRRKIQAWEGWNEPDIFFWPALGDRLSAMQKAHYLGLKDGNPNAIVLQPSFCSGPGPTARSVYESGVGDYFDVFNWHCYDDVSKYPEHLRAYENLEHECGVARRQAWATEIGVRISGTEGPTKGLLNAEGRRTQCQFVPRSVTMSLAAGNDRHFFFVLPYYQEGDLQFGALLPDLTPNPSFVALSAAANILGLAEYVGEYKAPDGITAHAFSTPKGNVIVAWSDKPTELVVPTEKSSVRVMNIFGAESGIPAVDGKISVSVGPDAVYLVDTGKAALANVTKRTWQRAKPVKVAPSRIVLDGHCDLPMNKGANRYVVGEKDKDGFDYAVVAYNFDHRKSASGTVKLDLPEGWRCEPREQQVTLEPMGRQAMTFKLYPGPFKQEPEKVFVRGNFSGQRVGLCVSYFGVESK